MTSNRKLNVVVLMGGPSAEHEVSLATGRAILHNLDYAKYRVKPLPITREGKWLLGAGYFETLPSGDPVEAAAAGGAGTRALAVSDEQASRELKRNRPDVAVLALHGEYGEDGRVQGLLEMAKIPYTGSGVLASALAMDKAKTLTVLKAEGLTVPAYELVDPAVPTDQVHTRFALPVVVKPNDRGSSVGVMIAKKPADLREAIEHARQYSERVMVQEYVVGVEVSAGVLDDGQGEVQALPPTEVRPKRADFWDYDAKYTPGASEEITPPNLPNAIIKRIKETAVRVHTAVGCSGVSRTDMILRHDGKLVVLEINTLPGMTETSVIPQQAKSAGISFPELLDRLIRAARART